MAVPLRSAAAHQFRARLLPTLKWPLSLGTSETLADLQIDYELATDALAGPMYHYYQHGNADYVFAGRHKTFQHIKSRGDLICWCRDVIARFRERAKEVQVQEEVLRRDQQLLLNHLEIIERLIDLFDECLREQYP